MSMEVSDGIPAEVVKSAGLRENEQSTPSSSHDSPAAPGAAPGEAPAEPPMSKNALKRLRKAQAYEAAKDERRLRRKEQRHERKGRKREERAALLAQGVDRSVVYPTKQTGTLVPVALVIDCDFEQYMLDKERVSLAGQLTRSYSDNRLARYKTHLWISGWHGKLRDRFQQVLGNQHKNWKGVGFCEEDYLQCAVQARERMKQKGGEMIEPLQRSADNKATWARDEKDPLPLPDPEPPLNEVFSDVVYLTSDSPYTLDRIEPHTTYVIGGLVDHNREKGLCYRLARERGIRTAKLPIGQFMVMQSRQVLATNHVVEIMLKWLEVEDWGNAFLSVIPKRKGGRLRGAEEDGDGSEAGAGSGRVDGQAQDGETRDGDVKEELAVEESEVKEDLLDDEPEAKRRRVEDELGTS
ncbi:hypothetical protein S40285_02327 [Stachybotrys chlorohalonatus IBT 40285]|uniref:tRNA (guanine(9)-N1)-methyltransferase n=1 Tax=Stachybotrys chlorohalonatus (strain IBT 40285) TaxID=1283841 RepID=A0A084QSC6_STAC4|nr:hypothetical protein S40285_02327 [Stachybotrys chlorohalonata IBT 40285]